MPKRTFKQPVKLDPGDVKNLSQEDLVAILRGAENLIGAGGRNLLCKILKGSSAKEVLEHGMQNNPSYGYYSDHSVEEISHYVDRAILDGYFEIAYSGKLPTLVYSAKGLMIEMNTIADEWFNTCAAMVEAGGPYLMVFLKDCNRQTVFRLLDKIAEDGNKRFIPFLEAWKGNEVKKVRSRINAVIRELEGTGPKIRKHFDICFVDESVDEFVFYRLRMNDTFRQDCDQYLFIKDTHPGIQDIEIIRRLLNDRSCLLSADRALHNAALNHGRFSFFLDREAATITTQPLEGIKPRGILSAPEPISDKVISFSATPQETSRCYRAVYPDTPTRQKKMRTKRRRIRNYFGGNANMAHAAITLSTLPCQNRGGQLTGIRIRITALSGGIKALDACELYVWDKESDPLAAWCHALILMIQLQLTDIPIEFFFDTYCLAPPEEAGSGSKWSSLFADLLVDFTPEPVLTACPKGSLIERLRSKLQVLKRTETNEIVDSDLEKIARDWPSFK
ncbi:MAG: hypothetical protein KDN22_20320 [Verrucomicrobiae bacterium]|nr:hypothetical protein [Verrucomicrobiae bacterium]